LGKDREGFGAYLGYGELFWESCHVAMLQAQHGNIATS